MDEEVGVKAPVTRLRRRLSVEQSEDGKSSPAPGTPTKKRGGRRAAKPELDLIDENVVENNLKKTIKKTIVKEITDTVEDKPVTPSRRSARIKSNTSIVSDTVQNVDSPRAKRASRRTSQVGSDTEMPITPARQTRRTRKDSTSSIDKPVDAVPAAIKTITQIPEVISEEPENVTKTTSESKSLDNDNTSLSPIRKSPRLLNKNSRSSNSSIQDDEKNSSIEDKKNDEFNALEHNISKTEKPVESSTINTAESHNTIESITDKNNSDKDLLSPSSANLIKDLDINPKKTFSHINKSLSEAQELNKMKPKRHRTKSWTTMTNFPLANEMFYSDNENTKKKHQEKKDVIGSGDNKVNKSKSEDLSNENLNTSESDVNTSARKKKKENSTISTRTPNKSASNNDDNLANIKNKSELTMLFQKAPSNNIKTLVLMEDSDSNSMQMNNHEDQCVPVVDHQLESKGDNTADCTLSKSHKSKKNDTLESKKVANDTCEPMDVDETLPDSLLTDIHNQEYKIRQQLLSENSQDFYNKNSKNFTISKRKSSMTLSTSQNLEKSDSENKSTLILSQLKDISGSDNNILKSPQISNKLLQSSNMLDVTQENAKVNKKLSLNYLTSTPLQQNADLSHHSDKNPKNIFNSSKEKTKTTPKKDMFSITNRSRHSSEEDSDSEDESSNKNSNLIDNEADEASDNYESGDSQDEEEKQYEKENEILEKGETLTSEDELSNDSDYDKDSFIVSSDEEDNELLSGSGDDLSMSDNELKMTAKSKKKYNERKLKEQKQASKEMFEARHKVNVSNNSTNSAKSTVKKNIRQRLESSQSEDDVIAPKKNKRIRLNSTLNESAVKSEADNSACMNKKKTRRLSESYNENLLAEKEITIYEKITNDVSDPLATQVKAEPKTPIKESDISIGFIDTAGIKDTSCGKNISVSWSLKSKNPLGDSDIEDSSSLSTEDENITQNYNDLLNKLKLKPANRSLNIEKESKTKSKPNNSIIEQLNLTQTKPSLRFKHNSSLNENISVTTQQVGNVVESLFEIPPKQQESDNVEISKLGDFSLNLDKKSKKKGKSIVDELNLTQIKDKSKKDNRKKDKLDRQKSIDKSSLDDSSDSIDLKLLFSEDSTNSGDYNKENKRKTEESLEEFIPLKKTEAKTDIRANYDFYVEAAENKSMLNESIKKPKKQKLDSSEKEVVDKEEEVSFFVDNIGTHTDSSENDKVEKNINKTSTKEGVSSTESEQDEQPLEISYKKEKSSIKEDPQNIQETNVHADKLVKDFEDMTEKSMAKTPVSEKKKKRKKSEPGNVSQKEKTLDKSVSATPETSYKMKKKMIESFNVSNLEYIFPLDNENQGANDESINEMPGSNKNKIKKISESKEAESEHIFANIKETDQTINKSLAKTPNSEKKKKKKASESFNESEMVSNANNVEKQEFDVSINNSNSLKKNKKRFSESEVDSKSGNAEKNKSVTNEATDEVVTNKGDNENDKNISATLSKKRKRSSSINPSFEVTLEDEVPLNNSKLTNESNNSLKKKRKISQNSEDANKVTDIEKNNINEATNSSQLLNESQLSTKSKKKYKNPLSEDQNKDSQSVQATVKELSSQNIQNTVEKLQDVTDLLVNSKLKVNKNKKRKNRDDDEIINIAQKVLKENSFDQIHIPRLPPSILNQLEDKPCKEIATSKKRCVISTTEFIVEEAKKRKNKPSNYLEESIYINDDDSPEAKKRKGIIKKPKVLPFIPTAATSNSGYTTNFKVNVIPQDIKFVAQSNNVTSFKNDYLYSKKIKRLGTYELYKRNRNIKMSKF